ncbi:MAG: zinc-dependent alcohol dehydrogenase [Candidatus Poribacteria bacterium]
MKATFLTKAYEFKEIDIEEPKITKPNDVIIDVKYVGICGTDMVSYQGKHELLTFPRVLGHEFSGVVTTVGEDVKNVKPGDQVTVEPLVTCGVCKPCKTGDYNVCEDMKVLGVHVDGACQERVVVNANRVFKLPPGTSLKEGVMIEPLAVSLEISRRGQLSIEDTVIIFGAGVIGLCVLKVAKCVRVRRIVSVDISDDKLKIAKDLGADYVINPIRENVDKVIAEITDGKGASLVIEASGAEEAIKTCWTVTAYRGRIVIIGFYKSPLVQIPPIHIVKKELDVYGSRLYRNRFPLAIDLLAKKEITLLDLISHEFMFDQIDLAMKTALNPLEKTLKVVIKKG